MKIFILFIFLALIIPFNQLFGQEWFTHLGIEKGLSNNSVNTIYKDRFGFMWFGTDDGLNQYNGYTFRVFRNNPNDTTSIVNNQVIGLAEDKTGVLWIATKRGASIFHNFPAKFVSTRFLSFPDKKPLRIDQEIYAIKNNDQGDIFIGTSGLGLLIYDARSKLTFQVPFHKAQSTFVPYSIRAIKAVKDRAWLINPAKGLAYYDYQSRQIYLVSSNGGIRNANSLEADSAGNLWIGSDHGLYRYNIQSKTFKWFNVGPGELLAQRILGLTADKGDKLLIATDGGGVNILNTKTETFSYQIASDGSSSLSSNAVSAIYKDTQGRTWIGTLRGGVNVLDRKRNEFKTIARNPLSSPTLASDYVLSFCEDYDDKVWVGTDGGGISLWNHSGVFKNFVHQNENPRSLSSNNITSIVRTKDNVIWVSTFGGAINRFDRTTGTFKHYACTNAWGKDENVWKLFSDSQGTLWAGTCVGQGLLYRYNKQQDKFEAINNSELKDIISINEDRTGHLWLGTFNRLFKYDPVHGEIISYNIKYPVRSIFFTRDGDLFIGTQYAGLFKYNKASNSFTAFTEVNGLSNNTVLNIEEDEHRNLWMSTFNGITKFNYKSRTYNRFYLEDGLQSNEFNYNASVKLSTGQIMFGGIKGFNIFYPDSVTANSAFPPLWITDFRALNEPLIKNSAYEQSIYTNQVVRVPYDKAVIAFDYSALEYTFPTRIIYSYYLEGLENKWNFVNTIRSGSYSRLNEGTYVLHLRSTNAEGTWNPHELTLKIIVLPPWYRSWWAYLIYLVILSFLLYQFNKYKSNQVRLNYKIEMAATNAEKERELNERKLSFFTHISHEFRTPLTLIINPVKEMLYSTGKNLDISDLSTVYLNAKRLLSLVDQLLLFRKADHEENELKISKLNIITVCKDVFLCFTSQARLKHIEFVFECREDAIEIFADREKVEIVLFNLLSNAFKFTANGGKISLRIFSLEHTVQIELEDNGKGIPTEIGDKLFDKFYQVNDYQNSHVRGFGIGLYLAKRFIISHKGALTYQSEVGRGTKFIIELQKGKSFLHDSIVYEDESNGMTLIKEVVDDQLASPLDINSATEYAELENLTSEQPTLLVIDDNEGIRRYIKRMFANSFVIYEAENGEDGLKIAKKQLPDVVISDVTMPVMDGIAFCTQIKNDPVLNHIPVVLLTSSTSSEIKLKGLECGADDYITKPFEADLFYARIQNILKSRTSLQRYFYNEITLQSDDQRISPTFKEFLSKCISITEQHLDDVDFNAKVLAQEVGMSHSALYKKVKSISGKSINEFIRFIRMRKAAEMLINSDCKVKEAAFKAGFINQKYFREQFIKLFDMTPTDYIKKYRKTLSQVK